MSRFYLFHRVVWNGDSKQRDNCLDHIFKNTEIKHVKNVQGDKK